MADLASYRAEGREQYLAILHYEGLNRGTYGEMKRSVHNGWLLLKQDTLPKKIFDTLLLCDKFHSEVVRPRVAATTTMLGVASVRQEAAEGTGSNDKDSKQKQPGVAAA